MEIGDQPVNYAELIAGGDEDVGFCRPGAQRTALRSGLQCAQAGGADSDDTTAAGAGALDGLNGGLRDVELL